MHKPENESHKIFRNFSIQTDLQILARRSDQMLINKKKKRQLANCPYSSVDRASDLPSCGFCCSD